jgi:tetratricopeptide (TPR) repeat protein
MEPGMTVTKRVVRLDADALAALEEQRTFLRRSLEDLEREREAGDLDAEDYRTLKHDYAARLDSVDRAVTEGEAEFAATRAPSRPGRTVLITVGVLLFALICGVVVANQAGRRDTGATITGALAQTARERNAECLNLARDKPVDAVKCYSAVLKDAPDNVEALTYRGWIQVISGNNQGLTDLRQAVMADSTYPDVHAFLAIVLYNAGCPADAANELKRLDALNPSPLIQQQIDGAGLRKKISDALAAPSTTAGSCGQG